MSSKYILIGKCSISSSLVVLEERSCPDALEALYNKHIVTSGGILAWVNTETGAIIPPCDFKKVLIREIFRVGRNVKLAHFTGPNGGYIDGTVKEHSVTHPEYVWIDVPTLHQFAFACIHYSNLTPL